MQTVEPVYPPPPWTLSGEAYQVIAAVPAAAARGLLPAGLRAACVWPGRSVGSVWVGRYGPGSSLEYGELMVVAPLARSRFALGAWVPRLLVDHAASLAGGWALWGLPKELGAFDWVRDGADVAGPAGPECSVRFRPFLPPVPVPLFVRAFAVRDGRVVTFAARGRSRVQAGWGDWELPVDSPFAALGLAGRRLTVRHTSLRLVVGPAAWLA